MHGDDTQDPPEVFPHDDSEPSNQDERSAQSELDNKNETIEEPVMVGGYSLRGNQQRNYDHCFAFLQHAVNTIDKGEHISDKVLKEYYNETVNICTTQMTVKKGTATYGKRAVDAIFKEFAQLDDLKVFGLLKPSKLTRAQKRMALRVIVLVKEKRCGKIKGCTVADGRPQRKIFTKDETTSPTVSLEGLLMSLMVDAKEERDITTADVGGAFLHRDMDDFVVLKMVGDAVDIMCQVNPSYEKFVTIENGKHVLYLQLLKALYGCVKAALIWYTLFSTMLKKIGFKLNPYDKCVANKVINGAQCTIAWYVDDNKISHIDPAVVTDILNKIKSGKLTITRGKQHTFLGMDIDFVGSGKVKILMKDYIIECIEAYKLKENKTLHHQQRTIYLTSMIIAQDYPRMMPLYIGNRARPDIILPVAFLCTRVQKPTEQDKTKLRRNLQYLNGTKQLFLTLGVDNLSKMHTWADASFAVHMDSKGHTGGGMSLGYGVILPKSIKQKLNAKSSTE